MAAKTENFESAQIGFRNFEGRIDQFNRNGSREFVIFLDLDRAAQLEADGWNVKYPKPKPDIPPEDDERSPFLPVEVSFANFPPKIVLVAGEQVSRLGEEELEMLDWAELENVDIVVNPYNWEMNGNTGVKAYAKAVYVTIVTDEFAEKYGVY